MSHIFFFPHVYPLFILIYPIICVVSTLKGQNLCFLFFIGTDNCILQTLKFWFERIMVREKNKYLVWSYKFLFERGKNWVRLVYISILFRWILKMNNHSTTKALVCYVGDISLTYLRCDQVSYFITEVKKKKLMLSFTIYNIDSLFIFCTMSQLFWKRVVILQAWCVKLQNYLKDSVSLAPKLILVLAMLPYESMSGNSYVQSLG